MVSGRVSLGAALFLLQGLANAAERHYNWTLTYETLPGTHKEGILINRKWPPESIEVEVDDKIILTVTNDNVTEGVSLHAHGFHQTNNNWQDGPVGVTQCDIVAGSTYTYEWTAEQAGTFWVHSHHTGQYPEGLRSPLIVRDPKDADYYGYDEASDFVLDMTDEWSDSWKQVEEKFLAGECCLEGETACGLEVPPDGATIHDSLTGTVTYDATASKGKTMRIRLINMSASSNFFVFASDPDIDMEVIEVDSIALAKQHRAVAKSVWIQPGQRYSLLIRSRKSFTISAVINPDQYSHNTCQHMNSYTGTTPNRLLRFRQEQDQGPAPDYTGEQPVLWNYALMGAAEFKIKGDAPKPYFKPNKYCERSDVPCYVSRDYSRTSGLVNLPEHAANLEMRLSDQWAVGGRLKPRDGMPRIMYDENSVIIKIDLTVNGGPVEKASLNHKEFQAPAIPILLKQMLTDSANCTNVQEPQPGPNQEVDQFYNASNTFLVNKDTTIFFMVGAEVGAHPFHLHGYDFQILYLGSEPEGLRVLDKYKSSEITWPAAEDITGNTIGTFDTPLRRDTIQIASKSYAVLAIRATNPGSWFLHCHNDFHALTGMAGTLVVDSPDTPTWNTAAIGQRVWEQCRSHPAPKEEFEIWQDGCCANPLVCSVLTSVLG